jgi:hypothetical protein
MYTVTCSSISCAHASHCTHHSTPCKRPCTNTQYSTLYTLRIEQHKSTGPTGPSHTVSARAHSEAATCVMRNVIQRRHQVWGLVPQGLGVRYLIKSLGRLDSITAAVYAPVDVASTQSLGHAERQDAARELDFSDLCSRRLDLLTHL